VRDGFKKVSHQKFLAEGTNGMSIGHRSETVPPIFIGKWTPRILFSLKERPYRHGQLRRRLGSISQRMLTRTLRNLEATGLIARQVTRSNSVAVEYSLTGPGRTLIAPLRAMCRWAKRHHRDVSAEVQLHGT
jgi:DNA-binding HxlR family transcriptional regulator